MCLGMESIVFGDGRKALRFGDRTIDLHEHGKGREPRTARPTPGSGDLCLLASTSLEAVTERLKARRVAVEEGPVPRNGARGPIRSRYVRDPDGNLVEICIYDGE